MTDRGRQLSHIHILDGQHPRPKLRTHWVGVEGLERPAQQFIWPSGGEPEDAGVLGSSLTGGRSCASLGDPGPTAEALQWLQSRDRSVEGTVPF